MWVLLLPASRPVVVGAILGLPCSKMQPLREPCNPSFIKDIQSERRDFSQEGKTHGWCSLLHCSALRADTRHGAGCAQMQTRLCFVNHRHVFVALLHSSKRTQRVQRASMRHGFCIIALFCCCHEVVFLLAPSEHYVICKKLLTSSAAADPKYAGEVFMT